mmetsp:Transcript_28297/g.85329  ORF Transcript_28297/g.85329 Transcript_28297/m.85329 type:complete len:131 (-) Transcript_28297:1748-2140(-)
MALRRVGHAASAACGAAFSIQTCRFLARDRSDDGDLARALRQFALFDGLRLAAAAARFGHDRDCANFGDTQAATLRELLARNAETAYGRDHSFSEILAAPDAVAAFRATHPVTTYEHVEPCAVTDHSVGP